MCKKSYTLIKACAHTHACTGPKSRRKRSGGGVWISRTSAHAYTWTHTSSRWPPASLTGSTVSGCVEGSQLLVNQQWLTVYTCTFWANRLHAYCKYIYSTCVWVDMCVSAPVLTRSPACHHKECSLSGSIVTAGAFNCLAANLTLSKLAAPWWVE